MTRNRDFWLNAATYFCLLTSQSVLIQLVGPSWSWFIPQLLIALAILATRMLLGAWLQRRAPR